MICQTCGDELKAGSGHLCGQPGNRTWKAGASPCARCGVTPADPSGMHACIPKTPGDYEYTGGNPYDDLTYETLSRLAQGVMAGTTASSQQDAMARWRERAERAEAEIERLSIKAANLEAQLNRANSELMHHYIRERANGVLGGRTIPQDMLTKLIRISHPDLHNNSELSNEVTKYLLSLRKK